MVLDAQELQAQLLELCSNADEREKAKGHNVSFDERISDARRRLLERHWNGTATLLELQASYVRRFVRVATAGCHSFDERNACARLSAIDEDQQIVRVELIDHALAKLGYDDGHFERMRRAVEGGQNQDDEHLVIGFLRDWNVMRDRRPAFAAFKDEVLEDLNDSEWAVRLRNRLGLAHLSPASGYEIRIALMEYSVKEVSHEAQTEPAIAYPFAVPTVLDSMPSEYFFPSPKEILTGRVLNLEPIWDDAQLVTEILHSRLTYERSHLKRLDTISTPIPSCSIGDLRNPHLWAVRIAAGRDDFGAEI